MTKRLFLLCALAAAGFSMAAGAAPRVEKLPNGILLAVDGGFLKVQLETEAVVRVLFSAVATRASTRSSSSGHTARHGSTP